MWLLPPLALWTSPSAKFRTMKLPLRPLRSLARSLFSVLFAPALFALIVAGAISQSTLVVSLHPDSISTVAGCTKGQEAKDAKQALDTALDVVQLGCLMQGLGAFEIDPALAAKICNVAPKLVPIVSDLIGYREAGRKAGVTWKIGAGLDAGAEGGSAR